MLFYICNRCPLLALFLKGFLASDKLGEFLGLRGVLTASWVRTHVLPFQQLTVAGSVELTSFVFAGSFVNSGIGGGGGAGGGWLRALVISLSGESAASKGLSEERWRFELWVALFRFSKSLWEHLLPWLPFSPKWFEVIDLIEIEAARRTNGRIDNGQTDRQTYIQRSERHADRQILVS